MNREQLSHVLRAAVRIAGDPEAIVLGSQAVLGSFEDRVLPPEATRSIEVDVAFRDDPGESKADQVDAHLGELSMFHQEFGYYGQGVSIEVAALSRGWEERLVPFEDEHHPLAVCLEPHDLVVAKLVARRPKDIDFAAALLRAQLVQAGELKCRVDQLDRPKAERMRVLRDIDRCAT